MENLEYKKLVWWMRWWMTIFLAAFCMGLVYLAETYILPGEAMEPMIVVVLSVIMWAIWLILWSISTSYKRAEIREHNRKVKTEQERAQQEADRITSEEHLRKCRINSMNDDLQELAGQRLREEIYRAGEIKVYYLNAAGVMRTTNIGGFRHLNRFLDKEDFIRASAIKVAYQKDKESSGPDSSDVFLKSPYWTLTDTGINDDDVFLVDHAGTPVPINSRTDPGTDARIREVLEFADEYSSSADYALKTIADYAIPILAETKNTMGESSQLANIRIALDMKSGIFIGRRFNTEHQPGMRRRRILLEGLEQPRVTS